MFKGKVDKVVEKLRRISKINGKKPDPWIYEEFIVRKHFLIYQNICCIFQHY